MKIKLFLIVLLSIIFCGQAFASKARLMALGEDRNGSYYIEDTRNIFLNAAQINNHRDFATFEWGSSNANVSDTDTTPKAEGGVIGTMGVFVFGVYLGRQDERFRSLRQDFAAAPSVSATANSYVYPDNVVDFFLGGDVGVKWGMNISYSKSKDETGSEAMKQDLMTMNFGFIADRFEGFLKSALKNSAQEGADQLQGKPSYKIGGTYTVNSWKLYGYVDSIRYEQTLVNQKTSQSNTIVEVGAGNTFNLNDKSRLYYRGTYFQTVGVSKVPVVIGLEVDVLPWLALRGSISQSFFSEQNINGKTKTLANTTDVNAGASFKFGNLNIDGLVGTGNNGSNAIASTTTEAGVLSADNIMTRVSVTYRF